MTAKTQLKSVLLGSAITLVTCLSVAYVKGVDVLGIQNIPGYTAPVATDRMLINPDKIFDANAEILRSADVNDVTINTYIKLVELLRYESTQHSSTNPSDFVEEHYLVGEITKAIKDIEPTPRTHIQKVQRILDYVNQFEQDETETFLYPLETLAQGHASNASLTILLSSLLRTSSVYPLIGQTTNTDTNKIVYFAAIPRLRLNSKTPVCKHPLDDSKEFFENFEKEYAPKTRDSISIVSLSDGKCDSSLEEQTWGKQRNYLIVFPTGKNNTFVKAGYLPDNIDTTLKLYNYNEKNRRYALKTSDWQGIF